MKKAAACITLLLTLGVISLDLLPQTQKVQAQVTQPSTRPFPDVPEGDVNVEAIQYLKDQGIVEGVFNKSKNEMLFRPNFSINRAEFVKIIVGAFTKTPQGSQCFKDVSNEWFAPYVCEAKTKGLLSGYEDGTFKPSNIITFSEASKIIAIAFNAEGEKGAQWYQQYVTALGKKNAIPFGITKFDQKITRGDMAEIIYRLKANVQNKLSRTYQELASDDFIAMDSCSALLERMKEVNKYFPPYEYGGGGGGGGYLSISDASGPTTGGGSDDYISYSKTNVQVEGVDEPDMVKNDGKFVYIIKENTVRMVEVYPAEKMQEKITFVFGEENEDFTPEDMYLGNNKLIVIGRLSRQVVEEDGGTSSVKRIKVFIIDVGDAQNPKLSRSVEFDGSYADSRRIDNTLYLMMSQSGKDTLPKILDSTTNKETDINCNQILVAPHASENNFYIFAAVPLNDLSKNVSVTATPRVQNSRLYASNQNLYITSPYRNDINFPSQNLAIDKFELKEDSINYKARGLVSGAVLNQFSMDEHNGYFRVATTRADGGKVWSNLYVLDSAMKTVGKVENIALEETIYSARFMGDRAYLVTYRQIDPFFVLDLKDPHNPKVMGELKMPGYSNYLHPYDENHILGFGIEEEAATFENPKGGAPVIQTIPKGMKVSLFDVSDIKNPQEKFKEVIGTKGTTSNVLSDHKALLFDKEKNLLAFPVILFEEQSPQSCQKYTYSTCPTTCAKTCVPKECSIENGMKVCTPGCDGLNSCQPKSESNETKTITNKPAGMYLFVYNMDPKNGFQLRGKVTHLAEGEIESITHAGYSTYYYASAFQKLIKRAFYIGENLYTVSPGMVKASALSDFTELKTAELSGNDTENYSYYEYYDEFYR